MNSFKINKQDLQILSNYKFFENGSNKQNDLMIGLKWIKEGTKWRQELITVKKQDVSCLSLFLSLFGMGKLKHISVSLNKISAYLYQYKWEEIKSDTNQNIEHPLYKAFKTVCHVANRQMQCYRKFHLFKKVSDNLQGEFNHYWNPIMNGRFLISLQNYYLPYATGIELRFKESQNSVLPDQKLTKEEVANIKVGYKYEEKANFQIIDPFPPYYSVRYKGSEKREI